MRDYLAIGQQNPLLPQTRLGRDGRQTVRDSEVRTSLALFKTADQKWLYNQRLRPLALRAAKALPSLRHCRSPPVATVCRVALAASCMSSMNGRGPPLPLLYPRKARGRGRQQGSEEFPTGLPTSSGWLWISPVCCHRSRARPGHNPNRTGSIAPAITMESTSSRLGPPGRWMLTGR